MAKDGISVEGGLGYAINLLRVMGEDACAADIEAHERAYLALSERVGVLEGAMENCPIIGDLETAQDFRKRQDFWLDGQYRAALTEGQVDEG